MQSFSSFLFKKFLLLGIAITLLFSVSLFGANTVRIMPLGDSITYDKWGGADTRVEEDRISYRGPLWTKLVDGGYDFDFVGSITAGENYDPLFDPDNQGQSGGTALDIAANVESYLTANPADIILLHIGTNDLDQYDVDTSVGHVEAILNNIDTYESVNTTHVKVLLTLIINRNPFHQATEDFNIKVREMAALRIANSSDDIVIVDMEHDAGFVYDNTDMENVLHPNVAGYGKMADLWYSTLVTVLTPTTPTHLWKLDEVSGPTYLDSSSGADGDCTVPGCPTADPLGKIDSAQSFDGTDDAIDVADTTNFEWAGDGNFTIEYWMKSLNVSGNEVIIGRDDTIDTPFILHWWAGTAGTKARFNINDSNGDSGNVLSAVDVTDGLWHHIAVVRDGAGAINLYVDGDINKGGTTTATFSGNFNDTTPVNIGYMNYNGSPNFHYSGTMDELTFYNSALGAAEIAGHASSGTTAVVTIADVAVTEGAGTATFTATLDNAVAGGFSVDVNTADVSTTAGTDYTALTGHPLTFTGTAGEQQTFTVAITDDSSVESSETFTVSMSNVSDLSVAITDTATGTITDNDIPPPTTPTHLWKLDEVSGPTYLDSSSGADGDCTVPGCPTADPLGKIDSAQSFDGTDDAIDVADTTNFEWAGDGNFTIEYWMKSLNVSGNEVIIGRDDTIDTPFILHWWAGTAGTKARFNINDSNGDSGNVLSAVDVTDGLWHHIAVVRDGAGAINLYVDGDINKGGTTTATFSGNFNDTTPVNIGYMNYNGSPNFHYSGTMDELTFYNSALGAAEIAANANPINYTISIAQTTDGAEPETNASFRVTTTPVNTTGAAITGSIAYSGTAINGTDYATGAATFSIADGSSTAVITLVTTDDALVEGTETIIATISSPSAGSLGTDNATANLTDDDTYEVSIAQTTDGAEPETNASFTVTTTPANTTGAAITGNIAYSGSATNGTDYATGAATFSIADGSSTAVIILVTTDDALVEGTETIIATISNPSAGSLGTDNATANLTDDDVTNTSSGGGCSYNPNSKNFDMTFLFMIALGLLYPWRKRFIK